MTDSGGVVMISFSDRGWEAHADGIEDHDEEGNFIGLIGCSSPACPNFIEALGCAVEMCDDLNIPDIFVSRSTAKLVIRDVAKMTQRIMGK